MSGPDLTIAAPRPLDAELEGYAWLPRMLDKARATLAGIQGPTGSAARGSEGQLSVTRIDAAPGAGETAHAHGTEEVIAVWSGEATLYLGAHQARIVRAGEIVRVPAGLAHRYVNTGSEPLGALAVRAAGA